MKNRTWKGIKEAVGTAKRIPNYWRIYADYSDNTVWCNEYVSENEWANYHSKNIKNVCSGYGYNSIFGQSKITMKELKERIEEVELYENR